MAAILMYGLMAVVGLTGCSRAEIFGAGRTSAEVPVPGDGPRSVASYFKVGDCILDTVEGATSVTLVDCAKLHAGEVYAIFTLPDGKYPGDDKGAGYKKQCGGAARAIATPETANDPTLRTIVRFPDASSWELGDRSITCIAASDPPRTGSIRGAG